MEKIEELAKMAGCSISKVYYMARKLNRLPTVKELQEATKKRNTIDYLAKATGRTRMTIYRFINELGRMPTVDEINNVKLGRKPKYK